ncbi:MAG: hypothetical protein IKC69_00785 [Clostridia bacterium]|nr:hypothetical protein [Clostridia bacterium]
MLKNSKTLKGITLVFALVMLLSCGILLTSASGAESNKIVLFVSDHGDNSTGKDEASAFTTFNAAIAASNAMKPEPGTELVLIVADTVTVTTQQVDSTIARDSEGNRMRVTVTSLNGANEDDFSSIILAYHNTSGDSKSRYASFYNDLNFLNIEIKIRVFETRVSNSPTGKRFHAKDINFLGVHTTFDHCLLGPEEDVPDMDYIYTYFDYGGNNPNVYMDKVVDYKNGSRFNSVFCIHYYRVRNIGLTVNFENVNLGTVHVNRTANTETIDDLKYMVLNIGNGTTIGNLYLVSSDGDHGFTEGMTVNYYPGCSVTGLVSGTSNTKGIIRGGITHNVYGGTFAGRFVSGTNGTVYGDITNNVYGGTFNYFAGGGGNNASAKTAVHGTVTNNIYGGVFNAAFNGAGSNVSEGSSYKATYEKVVNNIKGGTFNSTFIGGSDGPGSIESIENNVEGVDFAGVYYGGSINGCTIGDVVNNLKDVSIGAEYYAGNQKNGDITNLTNNIVGDCKFNARAYFGSFGNGSDTCDVTGKLENNIYGGTFASTAYGAGRTNVAVTGDVVTNIYGGTFNGTFAGGCRNPAETSYVSSITNNIYGGTFAAHFAGGQSESGIVDGKITNNVYGGTFEKNFYGGNYISDHGVKGEINTYVRGGTFKGVFAAANGEASEVEGMVNVYLFGGTFHDKVSCMNADETDISANVSLSLGAISETSVLKVLGPVVKGSATLIPSGNAIIIGSATELAFTGIGGSGSVLFSQTEDWVDGKVYATANSSIAADRIKVLNASSEIAGSGLFDGVTLIGTTAAATDTAPSLSGLVSFHLNEDLGVRFWIKKDEITNYIAKNGSWSYTVSFAGEKIADVTFTSADQLPAADIRTAAGVEYFTFQAGLGISATSFDEEIEIVLDRVNSTVYTVYELLENGAANTEAAGQTELSNLLKSIHNYAVEASNAFENKSDVRKYQEIGYSGTYQSTADSNKTYGYSFYGYTLSLEGQVSLNFYFQAANDVDFQVKVAGTNVVLDSSKITVKKITDNENYNYVVSVKLTVPEMVDDYTVSAVSGSSVKASCTYGVTRACAAYIEGNYGFAGVADALLAYVEASQSALNA